MQKKSRPTCIWTLAGTADNWVWCFPTRKAARQFMWRMRDVEPRRYSPEQPQRWWSRPVVFKQAGRRKAKAVASGPMLPGWQRFDPKAVYRPKEK